MGEFVAKSLLPTTPPKVGFSSEAATDIEFVSISKSRAWAAASTFTANVRDLLMSPVKPKVSAAVVPPDVTPETPAIDTSGISVTNSKLDTGTTLPKVVPVSDKLTVAVFRFASVNDDGLVDTTDAPETIIMKLICARSVLARFESASCTLTVTVLEPVAVGVPQTVRGLEPEQLPLPSASKTNPVGRLVTV